MRRLLVFLFALWAIPSYAQNLFVSNEYLKAIENGTRSKDGRPGPEYWTNHSDYVIEANFNPKTGYLKGKETVTYHNNSPDTLDMIVLRLYQDIWKKGNVRDFVAPEEDLTGGTLLKTLIIDGQQYGVKEIRRYNTLAFIRLKKPILPHSTAKLEIAWECQLPTHRPIRYGKYDKRTFFVAYWYPEIAVYDDVYGWDTRPFTGIQEYHNDHNNFDVRIRVMFPNLVWAPGELVNAKEIFNDHIVKKIERAKKSSKVVHIITLQDISGKMLKQLGEIEWHFKARNIPEFAFGTSDHYVWDGLSLKLGDRRVFISAAYNPDHKTYEYMAQLARDILDQYSNHLLKIPYPYEKMTVFNGGGAMEFPMMVNESEFTDTCANYYVTAHEIGHTYFPFLTGTNETMFAWMDEGLINYFPRYAAYNISGGKCKGYFEQMVENYKRLAGTAHDLPVMVPSSDVGQWETYRHIAYNKPAFALYELTRYLGDSLFFAALHEFVLRWQYKHPYPYDFFFTFNDIAGEDLSWFWQPYFFEYKTVDLAVSTKGFRDGKFNITVTNKGGLPVGFTVFLKLKDGRKVEKYFNAGVWKNSDVFEYDFDLGEKPVEISVKDDFNVDLRPQNNNLPVF